MNLEEITHYIMENGAHFCDIRKEKQDKTVITVHNGEPILVRRGQEEGFMVRTLVENGWGYMASSNFHTIKKSARKALSMAKWISKSKNEKIGLSDREIIKENRIIPMKKNIVDISPEEKIVFLKEFDNNLQEDSVQSVTLEYHDMLVEKEIYSNEGTHITMIIPRVYLSAIVVGKNDSLQRVVEKIGSTGGFEIVEEAFARNDIILNRLEALLHAQVPPTGHMSLIMDPHLTGIFIHEALGHAAEGDVVASTHSCLEGKIGEKIAAESVTITDDPTMKGYGQYPFDDEGTKAVPRILVKDGVCNDYILDRESAWKLRRNSNGGARAEDFRVKPLVRMSNTMMKPGIHSLEELIEQAGTGIYAQSSRGGEVDPAQGTFQFNTQVAYKIEKGELTVPLRDVSFSGSILSALQSISGLSSDFEMRASECGKGQIIPVSSGGPHVLLDTISVGGRA